jgi:hypothetical protein
MSKAFGIWQKLRYFSGMTLKKTILISIISLTFVFSVVIYVLGKQIFTILFLGASLCFLVYALWNPVPKHKTFSYMDIQRGMRAFNRSEMLKFTIGSRKKKKKKRK